MILLDKVKFSKKENVQLFAQKVQNIANALGVNADWLMVMMHSESGLNPQAVNKDSGATGLIQFMPNTAKALGTSTQMLYNMTAIEQLDYVGKYFQPYAGKLKSYVDLYTVVFFPLALGKPDGFILQTKDISATTIAKQNPFDYDKDGKITAGEMRKFFLSRVPKPLVDFVQKKNLNWEHLEG